jgi:RND family efflux transporter MFP subunit
MRAARLSWTIVGLVMTLAMIWQASRAGWIQSARMPAATLPPRSTLGPRVPTADHVIADGKLVAYPGSEVTLATEVSGRIISLPVQEKSVVHRGDLIVELLSDDLQESRDEALARVAEAEADIRFFELEIGRTRLLLARSAASLVELQGHERSLDTSRARRKAALAQTHRFEALIAKTHITSPIDGVVIARFVHPGETVDVAARLVTVADLKRVRVEAEVDEFDISGITLRAHVKISAEGFSRVTWKAEVEEIPDVVVGRRLRPEDPGRPADTRVLLVKIALLEPTPLKLGQRVGVEILTVPPSTR